MKRLLNIGKDPVANRWDEETTKQKNLVLGLSTAMPNSLKIKGEEII